MRVVVVGAGVIGVTSAYYLRQHGFEVDVLERASDVALETSADNAGIIAPGYVTPWAAPGMPGKVLSYLFKSAAPVLFRPNLDPALWRWLGRWLLECRLKRFRINKERMQRVAHYSRQCLHQLRDQHAIEYQQRQGYLQLFRSQADVDMSQPARDLLREQGVEFQLLDAAGVYKFEPSLSRQTALSGALFLPGDESGNCAVFTKRLRVICEQQGVRFHFGQAVDSVQVSAGRVSAVRLAKRSLECDTLVMAAGVQSVALLRPLGIRLPIYPVKGYSVSVQLKPDMFGPMRALMDEAYKTAITPFGHSMRIAGTAELGSRELSLRESALATLRKVADDWFPGAGNFQAPRYWVGARPMLPDGPPLLGPSKISGLHLNCGHGSTGWAMACGSSRLVADIIAGREPDISMDGLTLQRYR